MEQFGRRVNGRTIVVEGVLYWALLDRPQRRVTAIYHNELRSRLLTGDGDPDQYTHPRQKGKAPNDKTAFHKGQAYWGVSSANWPDVLWKFKPDETRHYATPPTWYHEGKLVISAEKQPMAIFPELPSVLSSKYEGAFIVAVLRQNSAITYEDLRSRMPSGSHKNKVGETSPISINTLSRRASEFRNSKGLLSWDRSDPKRESYLSSLLTATQKQNNTIRGGASFMAVERARLILIGQGSQPNRSRKAEGDETSAKRAAKSKAHKEKLLKQAKLDEEGLRNLRERFSSGPTAELSTIFGGNQSVADRSAGNTSKEFESSHESSEEDSEDSSDEESSEEDSSEGDSHEDDRAAPPALTYPRSINQWTSHNRAMNSQLIKHQRSQSWRIAGITVTSTCSTSHHTPSKTVSTYRRQSM
ncbi:MAG: hypothetical protein Q9199_003153 [Rusavskia elegans]